MKKVFAGAKSVSSDVCFHRRSHTQTIVYALQMWRFVSVTGSGETVLLLVMKYDEIYHEHNC